MWTKIGIGANAVSIPGARSSSLKVAAPSDLSMSPGCRRRDFRLVGPGTGRLNGPERRFLDVSRTLAGRTEDVVEEGRDCDSDYGACSTQGQLHRRSAREINEGYAYDAVNKEDGK